jgi:hypothetical protein
MNYKYPQYYIPMTYPWTHEYSPDPIFYSKSPYEPPNEFQIQRGKTIRIKRARPLPPLRSSKSSINWNDFFICPTQTFKEAVPEKPVEVKEEELLIARPERKIEDDE